MAVGRASRRSWHSQLEDDNTNPRIHSLKMNNTRSPPFRGASTLTISTVDKFTLPLAEFISVFTQEDTTLIPWLVPVSHKIRDVIVQVSGIRTLLRGTSWHECITQSHGPLTRYAILWVAHAQGMSGTFSPPPGVSDPDMHHGTHVTHVPWCMPGSLTSGFLWSRWQGNHSRHSQGMCNPQF